MKKTKLNFLTYILPALSVGIAPNASAEEPSPLSPALILKPAQILSTTELSYFESHFDVKRVITAVGTFSASAKVSGTGGRQSIRVGLLGNSEFGISETYSDAESSRSQIIRVTDGFSNPTISAKKTWGAESDARVSVSLAATPKTSDHGLRAFSTKYNTEVSGVFITPSGLVTNLALSRNFINGNGKNSTIVQAGMYKEFASYSLSVIGTVQSFDHQSPRVGFSEIDTIHTISAAVGRQVSERAWLQLTYKYADGDYQPRLLDVGDSVDASYSTNELGVSLKVLF